jgi:transposase
MQVVHARCCGLDVHKKTVVACVLLTAEDGAVQRMVRTFSTMTADLLALSDWLCSLSVTHVAMESTGVYWWPVFNVLEDEERTLIVVNPQHKKHIPGHKTDVKDSEWMADLLRHGLLRASFIPPAPIRALRELVRYRKNLVQQRTQEVNRLHKVLESANIKLATVATDVMGMSGRDMLAAIIDGEEDASALADLARRTLRKKLPALRAALTGRVQAHHRVLLALILGHIDYLNTMIVQLQAEIDQVQVAPSEDEIMPADGPPSEQEDDAPFLSTAEVPAPAAGTQATRLHANVAQEVALLQTIPGVGAVAATTIIAEIGVDMRRFVSAKHLASWAGVCPGNHQSAGRRGSSKPTGGNPWLKAVLGEVACSIARRRGSYLHAQFPRIARRRGRHKALVAVAHSVLRIIYYMLRDKRPYEDLGPDYFDKLDATRMERYHVRRLEQLGFTVSLLPSAVS